MPLFEGIEVSRSLEDSGWVDEIKQGASELFGAEAMDFDHPELSGHDVVLWDGDEMADAHMRTGMLGSLVSEHLVEVAEMNMPKTFMRDTTVYAGGNLAIKRVVGEEGANNMLITDILLRKPIKGERDSAAGTIERITGVKLPARSPRARVKLAVVDRSLHVPPGKLAKLAGKVPERTGARRGRVKPARFMLQNEAIAA
ncbi:MAG TPA: hypothetical protein VFW77_05320 [Candidatus Saccharimonadales bacterium]|nr:hypothetical protein [Candidatus Saccharimonadales bacterium]